MLLVALLVADRQRGDSHSVVQERLASPADKPIHVYRVLEDVGKQIKELHPDVLEPTRIDGLDNFSESELTIRTSTKVKPGKHLPVQRLVRKLIKEAFDRENVEIPFARRVLILKNQTTDEQPNIKDLTDEFEN